MGNWCEVVTNCCVCVCAGRYDVSVSDPHSSRDSRGRTPLQLAAELGKSLILSP